ncbi:unnamed protein product [Nippostrongylus brasiliensis]|uniref:Peptidase A2 domain-containing protein n=1 Tax=Nippostrongylus brasiliensis TaxID=27835 RepID=A0A0N4YRI8_NIPBR|nr:unnamed protein product [Nippostrongylus brasiliensis]
MDPQLVMAMFKELMEEQRKIAEQQQKDMIAMMVGQMTGVRGSGHGSEEVSVPNVMSALSHRIDRFIFDPEVDMGFSRWFSRYKEVLMNDAKQLPESARVRLLCEKLDTVSFEKYQRHVLPREVSEIGFDETVLTLKQLFDLKSSEFTTKYQCLNLEKNDSEDYLTYMGRVNEMCEKARIHELDSDGIKCLLWIFGLKSQKEAEQLHKECEKFLSLKRDSDTIAGNVRFVEEARKAEKKVVCWNCEKNHYVRQCQAKPWFCKKCKKIGHKEKYCEDARRGTDRRSSSTERRRNSRDRIRKTKTGAKRHVQVTRIANGALDVNATRMYVEAVVNNHKVEFLLDTGSDITLLNEKVWKQMGAPSLEKTNVLVKNASGNLMKIYGRLKCEYEMKGHKAQGYAYVTPFNSLMGLEWIQSNEEMVYHMKMMVAEVKAKDLSVEKELMETYPTVFEGGLGLCTKEKAELILEQGVRPVFRGCRPVAHAAMDSVDKELDRLLEMGVITPVTHSEWAAPIVCVRKANGKLRVCADFSTGLNKALQSFDYPLPVPEDIFASLNGGTVFSQIDLSDAYLQIELSDEAKKKVVINTHRGLFQYNRLPFGIKTAPGIFQQIMNKMVSGLRGVATYLDDILVCGKTELEHKENLLALFGRIEEYGFKLRLEKKD